MSKPDLYQILELSPQATPEDIKRAYRRLARQYHPDHNPDPEQNKIFMHIQNAYEVLSDPDRRLIYDTAAVRRSIRGESDPAAERRARNEERRRRKSRPSGSQPGTGPHKSMRQTSASIGTTLRNFFSAPDPQPRQRTKRSHGRERRESGGPNGSTHIRAAADAAGSMNVLVRFAEQLMGSITVDIVIDALESLNGTTRSIAIETESRARSVKLEIPPGIVPGSTLEVSLPAEGDFPRQSLKVRVHIESHRLVERDGIDVTIKLPITVREALQGSELDVPTPEGPVRVRLPAGWDMEHRLRIKDRGFRDPATGQVGELYVKPYIQLPQSSDPNISAAATAIDHFYRAPVRSEIPQTIGKRAKQHS